MASHPIYQFYAELSDYEPKIWRRFQVMNNVTMARLGYILMTMFEMQASHLFCFDVPVSDNFKVCVGQKISSEANQAALAVFQNRPELLSLRIQLPDEEYDFDEDEGRVLNAAETTVKHVVDQSGEQMIFSYDYGDGWEILLRLEEIIEDKQLPGKVLPRVLTGEGYGIIEDCGGPGGLSDLATAFKKKKGQQYRQYCQWLGRDDLDLSTFNLDDMNYRLKKNPPHLC